MLGTKEQIKQDNEMPHIKAVKGKTASKQIPSVSEIKQANKRTTKKR